MADAPAEVIALLIPQERQRKDNPAVALGSPPAGYSSFVAFVSGGEQPELPKALYFRVKQLIAVPSDRRRVRGILNIALHPVGHRNQAIYRAACSMSTIVPEVLSEEIAIALLYECAVLNGYIAKHGARGSAAALATIRSGLWK